MTDPATRSMSTRSSSMRTARCSMSTPSARWPSGWRPVTVRALAQLWRTKQLEYTWLQSLMAVCASPRGFRPHDRACARLRAWPRLGFRSERRRGALAGCVSHARPVSRRRAALAALRRARAGSCPTARLPVSSRCATQWIGGARRRRAVGRRRRHLQAGAACLCARGGSLAACRRPHRLRFVELLGCDRRPRFWFRDVLDQPYRRTARSSRTGPQQLIRSRSPSSRARAGRAMAVLTRYPAGNSPATRVKACTGRR